MSGEVIIVPRSFKLLDELDGALSLSARATNARARRGGRPDANHSKGTPERGARSTADSRL